MSLPDSTLAPAAGYEDGPDRIIFTGAEDIAWNDEGKAAYQRYADSVYAIGQKTQQQIGELLQDVSALDPMLKATAFEEGMVSILKRQHHDASAAAAAYFDAERVRQTGIDDGVRAEVHEMSQQQEQEIRGQMRAQARSLFGA